MIGFFPPPPRPLRPVQGFAVVVLVALGVDVFVEVVWVVAGPGLASAAAYAADGPGAGVPDAQALLLLSLLALLTLARGVVAIAFVAWLVRVRRNAESLSRVPHRWFKVFIVLGWLLPVVNWWIPKQIVDDVWASSRPGGVRTEHIGREVHSRLIWAWWVSWLLAFWVLPSAYGLLVLRQAGEPFGASLPVDVLLLVPTLVAAVLAAAVVLRITRLQEGVSARVSGFSPYQ